MARGLVFLVAVFLLSVADPSSSADCPYPACSCYDRYIDCSRRGFKQVPPLNVNIVNSFMVLRLENNQLGIISDNSFPFGLTEIDLSNNPISTISPGAFNTTATTLEILTITNCYLNEIPDAFLSLTRLTSLTIKNAPVRNWKPNVLQHLGSSLKMLVVSNVGIISWPNWLQYLPSLTTLSFAYTQLSPIPDTGLNQLANSLEVLSLTTTYLTKIPKALTALTKLRSLDLTNNRINEVENLPYLSQLQTLSLGNNNISDVTKLEQELSAHTSSLTYLYLYNNRLPSIPSLANMTVLELINLDTNQIKDSTGTLPASVTSLQLRQNRLTSVPDQVRSLPKLRNLQLNDNFIQEIPSANLPKALLSLELKNNSIHTVNGGIFPLNSTLKYLYLDYNPIENITVSAFENLSQLQNLYLRNTSLTRVPLALSRLSGLLSLDMTNNGCLVCTCGEADLAGWFGSRSGLVIQGTCGTKTISEFLDNLPTECPEQFY